MPQRHRRIRQKRQSNVKRRLSEMIEVTYVMHVTNNKSTKKKKQTKIERVCLLLLGSLLNIIIFYTILGEIKGMRGAGTLIPARFLTLLSHLCVVVTLLWESHQTVRSCLPSQFHDQYLLIYHNR